MARRICTRHDDQYYGSEEGQAFSQSWSYADPVYFVGNMLGLPFNIVTEYHDASKATFFNQPLVNVVEVIHKAHDANPGGEVEVGVSWWKSPTADASVSLGLAGLIF